MRYFTNLHIVYSLLVFCAVSAGTYHVILTTKYNLFLRKICLRLILIDALACLAIIINLNHTIADLALLITWQCMGCLIYLTLNDPKTLRDLSTISGFYIIIVVLWKYIRTDSMSISLAIRSGENTISILLILFVGIDLLICETSNLQFNYVFYILALTATLLVGGVAGTITMSYLMLGIYFFKNRNNFSKAVKLIVMLIITALFLYIGRQIIYKIVLFVQSGDWTQRMLMIQTYWEMTLNSLSGILFGVNIEKNAFLYHYKNLHNSFFNWHYFYGLLPCLFFTWIVIKDIVFMVKRRQFLLLTFATAMVVRALADETSYAYMMIWIAIYCLAEKEKYIKNNSIGCKEFQLNENSDFNFRTL